ncbi:hypothetical protein bthur0010_52580 [Bacillus thuringiensis serovar pondicheriensis BGSC 4BA1]|nr:hypothetical protein bthur0010_52580 [Bacillus thuringiensis serovar pondicheriensis BGSC 4BA1]
MLSAMGEYVERYCSLQNHTPLTYEKYNFESNKINPSLFDKFEKTNSPFKKYNNDVISWIKGKDLKNNEEVKIPAQAAYLTYIEGLPDEKFWMTNSTGVACSPTLDGAIWRGLAECFERDAIQTMWQNQISIPKIDYLKNKELSDFYYEYIHSKGITFYLYEFKMDWDIPAVFGIAEIENGGIVAAAAVRSTWQDACKKTLVELAQSLVGYAPLLYKGDYPQYSDDYMDVKSYDDHSMLYFHPKMKKFLSFLLDTEEYTLIPETECVLDDQEFIQYMIEQANKIDKSMYWVDLTLPEIKEHGWYVVRTLIPGLADIEPGYKYQFINERVLEIPQKLIELGKRKPEHFNGKPITPHPFP